MRCNVWGWLLGLPVLALIWGLGVSAERAPIINDLQGRTEAALKAADLDWARTRFDVIEGWIGGRAYSEDERRRAVDIVRRTWGVWNVRDETDLIDEAPDYVWGARVDGERLALSGYVPNERTRRRIVDIVRDRFPEAQINDDMLPARGVHGEAVWIEGIDFGLRQLSGLKQGGQVELQGTRFTISGEAKDVDAYRTIKGDVRRRLPNGIVLVRDETAPPQVSPFTWRARFKASQLELSGHVPSEEVRGEIVETAKQVMPKAAIVDKMTAAGGAPANWANVVNLVLREMANLEEADARLYDETLTIEGVAQKEVTSQRVTSALNVGRPENFTIDNLLTFREPTLPTISPFTTTIVSDGETVSLTGVAPDERRRQRVVALVRERFPGREVVDALTYANGAPAGWLACADAVRQVLDRVPQPPKDGRQIGENHGRRTVVTPAETARDRSPGRTARSVSSVFPSATTASTPSSMTSASRSTSASGWRSSAPTAVARARWSTSSAASTTRRRGMSSSTACRSRRCRSRTSAAGSPW